MASVVRPRGGRPAGQEPTESIPRLADQVGLKGITAHTFRRMAASELIAAGVDAASAAGRMGNSIPVMLDRYVRSADDRSVAAAGMLHERLKAQELSVGGLLFAEPAVTT